MQRPILPRPVLPLARHRDFLSRLACWPRPTMPGTPLERVLLRPPRLVQQNVWLAVQATLALRHPVHLPPALQRPMLPATPGLAMQQQLLRVLRERAIEQHSAHRHAEQQQWRQRHQLVLQAPAARMQVPAAAPPAMHQAQVRRAYPPVATAVVQPGGARGKGAEGHRPAQAAIGPAAEPGALRAGTAPAPGAWPPPPLELARFTAAVSQQVMHQLERRALSARERSGRL